MLGFTTAIDQSESRTQACHVRISDIPVTLQTVLPHFIVVLFKGESFRPRTKISSNYNDHTFEVFI